MNKYLIMITIYAGFELGYGQCPSLERASGDRPPEVKVSLRAKQNPVKEGSRFFVEVTTANPTDHEVSYWKNTNSTFFPIVVADEAGKWLPDKRPGFRNGRFDQKLLEPQGRDRKLFESGEIVTLLSGGLACITLKPRESFVEVIEVTKFFDMRSPGKYTIAMPESESGKSATQSISTQVVVEKQ